MSSSSTFKFDFALCQVHPELTNFLAGRQPSIRAYCIEGNVAQCLNTLYKSEGTSASRRRVIRLSTCNEDYFDRLNDLVSLLQDIPEKGTPAAWPKPSAESKAATSPPRRAPKRAATELIEDGSMSAGPSACLAALYEPATSATRADTPRPKRTKRAGGASAARARETVRAPGGASG